MKPTHVKTRQEYRVIYNANGDLWAREVIDKSMIEHKAKTLNHVNLETARMAHRIGLQATAAHYVVTTQAIYERIKRLEKQVGFKIFPTYCYHRPTYHGRMLLEVQ